MEMNAVAVNANQSPSPESKVLEQSILSSVQQLARSGSDLSGRSLKAISKNALSKLAGLSAERKSQILDQTRAQKQIVADLAHETGTEYHEEWPLIEKAMSLYGLHLKDDFKKILHRNDVIEIYNAEHLQIFRTFNFYEYSAYSYLDLLVNEWFHLWERPKSLLERMYAIGQSVTSGNVTGIMSMADVPEHVYKEIYNSEDVANFEVRSVLCKFGSICPLYKADGQIGGFIINCRVKVLGMGEETENLSFL